MNGTWQHIPQFWQGVITSLVAAAIFAALAYIVRISSSQLTENRRKKKEEHQRLAGEIASHDQAQRTESSLVVIYNVVKYLMIGNILWIAGEIVLQFWILGIEPIVAPIAAFLSFMSLIYFYIGLRWVHFFQKHKK